MVPPTYTRSHELYLTRWCDLFDLFDVPASTGDGWMLLDLPGAPCDVTQPQMRTMSQRLRKAQECAAAGGKYGLVQAVLLSMDSQPLCPAHWLRVAVALEACSKVLLPAAHKGQLDLGAARAAYQQLTPAEQRLWCQLQSARIQWTREKICAPASTAGYDMYAGFMANVLAAVSGDPSLVAHEHMRAIICGCNWGLVCRLYKRYGLVGVPGVVPSMQSAYNWALAAYFHHGKDHPETKAALAATKAADPHALVPRLLAGLAYPALCMAPGYASGSSMEAVGYAHHFGPLWSASSSQPMERMMEVMMNAYSTLSTPLKWLMGAHDIAVPNLQQQRDTTCLRILNCGDPVAAVKSLDQLLHTFMGVANARRWQDTVRLVEELGAAKTLRSIVVYVASIASLTMNLPPISAAPRLWEGFGEAMGGVSLADMAMHLLVLAQVVAPAATQLASHYALGSTAPHSAAGASAGGHWTPGELEELSLLAPSLCVAASRWLWQCGEADMALQGVAVASAVFVDEVRGADVPDLPGSSVQRAAADGYMPASARPVHDLTAFLVQEKQRQQPGAGLELAKRAQAAAVAQGAAASAAMMTAAGDPAEQRLYQQFPVWLDQLVSQVTGRRVTLVIQPQAAHRLDRTGSIACQLFLKDAGSGQQRVFGWRRPGDVNWEATYDMFVLQARQCGCTDPELLDNCPAVEPLEQVAAAGAGITNSSSRSSSSRERQNLSSQAQAAKTPAAAAAADVLGGRSAGGGSQALSASSASPLSPAACAADDGGSSCIGTSSTVKPAKPCAACGELFPKLKVCTRCRAVSYCSKDCQVAHWKAGHKQVCQEQPAK